MDARLKPVADFYPFRLFIEDISLTTARMRNICVSVNVARAENSSNFVSSLFILYF
jgi:hypothetical protein